MVGVNVSLRRRDRRIPRAKEPAIGLMSLLWFVTSGPIKSLADDLFIYPTKNQSAEQQDKDKWECRAWATKQTGFDPAARATASTPPPTREAPRGSTRSPIFSLWAKGIRCRCLSKKTVSGQQQFRLTPRSSLGRPRLHLGLELSAGFLIALSDVAV